MLTTLKIILNDFCVIHKSISFWVGLYNATFKFFFLQSSVWLERVDWKYWKYIILLECMQYQVAFSHTSCAALNEWFLIHPFQGLSWKEIKSDDKCYNITNSGTVNTCNFSGMLIELQTLRECNLVHVWIEWWCKLMVKI